MANPLKLVLLLGAYLLLCLPGPIAAQNIEARSHVPQVKAQSHTWGARTASESSHENRIKTSALTAGRTVRPPESPYTQPVPPDERPLPGVPAIQVTLPRRRYVIKLDPKTGEPQMPTNVIATAETYNWPADLTPPQSFQWHVMLEWNYPKYPTRHEIGDRIVQSPSPFYVDFGTQIRGGLLTVAVSTTLAGHVVVGKAYAEIVGENPTHTMVLRAYPRTRFGLIASKIGMAESSFQQFMPACGDAPGGQPYLSRTNDIGIMQLNAPTGSVTSEDQIWDWRANVRRGMEELADKSRVTTLASRYAPSRDRLPDSGAEQFAYVNLVRLFVGLSALTPPPALPLSDKPGSGILPDDPDVDHLRLTQYERDTIRRYNGGSEYAYSINLRPDTPYPISMGWEIDPTRGGVRPTSGDPDYVRHVLQARSGLTLPPPPAPAKKAVAERTHRKRRHKTPKQ